MAVTNAYATVAEVRDHFQDASSNLDLDLLEKAINASSRAIDQFCGRRFWLDAAVTVRTYRPQDPYELEIDDIGTTTGVIVKTDTTGDATWATTWDSADYQLEPLNSDVVASGDTVTPYAWWRIAAIDDKTFPVVTSRRTTLQVTAKFGWSSVPHDVNEACILKAAALFKRKEAPFGVAGFGEFGAVRIGRHDPDVMDLLGPYVRVTKPDR